jgi:hypothetical protein
MSRLGTGGCSVDVGLSPDMGRSVIQRSAVVVEPTMVVALTTTFLAFVAESMAHGNTREMRVQGLDT